MKEPTLSTLKRLFALSGNRCAHPQCKNPIAEASGVITGIVCHIKARNPKGPRYDKKQTDEQRHSAENLILLCSRHSKIIDTDLKTYSVELLHEFKDKHERNGSLDLSAGGGVIAQKILEEYRAIYIHHADSIKIKKAGSVTFNEFKGKITIDAPEGSIGRDLARKKYAKHLIDRYNDFASKQPGRTFRFMVIYAGIKKRYGAKWDMIGIDQFPSLCSFLHGKIDRTELGKINRSQNIPNYSQFEEYLTKYSQR